MDRRVLIMFCVYVSKTLTETRKMHFHVHFSHPSRMNFQKLSFFRLRLTFMFKSVFLFIFGYILCPYGFFPISFAIIFQMYVTIVIH